MSKDQRWKYLRPKIHFAPNRSANRPTRHGHGEREQMFIPMSYHRLLEWEHNHKRTIPELNLAFSVTSWIPREQKRPTTTDQFDRLAMDKLRSIRSLCVAVLSSPLEEEWTSKTAFEEWVVTDSYREIHSHGIETEKAEKRPESDDLSERSSAENSHRSISFTNISSRCSSWNKNWLEKHSRRVTLVTYIDRTT